LQSISQYLNEESFSNVVSEIPSALGALGTAAVVGTGLYSAKRKLFPKSVNPDSLPEQIRGRVVSRYDDAKKKVLNKSLGQNYYGS